MDNLKEQKQSNESFGTEYMSDRLLVLYNDDYHTFDFVIDALIEICNHDMAQAEQCTYIVHYKGKCEVKKGSYHELKPMRERLIDKGLNATID